MIAWFAEQPLALKIVLAGLGSLLLLFLLWRLWLWLRKYLEWQNVKTLEIKERVGLKIEFIKTAAQILGGAFFLITIYVAWQNLVVSQEKHKTDLFTKATEQLGSEKMEVRLGGIYALERIARDSGKDHGPIMEVLTAFVRLHAPWPPEKPTEAKEQLAVFRKPPPGEKKAETNPAPEVKPRADIQAILTVLRRRSPTYRKSETRRLDLRQTDLRGADLFQTHLESADLFGAHLEKAILQQAHLEGADLRKVHLEEADLFKANLEGAKLNRAHLEGAILWRANLMKADLSGAHLEKAILAEAHIENAYLWNAHMEGAKLPKAHLDGAGFIGARLEGANLQGADLRTANGLTQEQIDSVTIDEKTMLPVYLKRTAPDKAKSQ
jgi:uncharacterized protein YjbI with pentapeptide repeats